MSGGEISGVIATISSDKERFNEKGPRPPTFPGQEQDQQQRVTISQVFKESCGGPGNVCLTPRKSNLHGFKNTEFAHHCYMPTPCKTDIGCNGHYEDRCVMEDGLEGEPPLGYEPEGCSSAYGSPPFAESRTPPFLKWAQNIRHLLNDGEGVDLFRKYLMGEGCEDSLSFWFACEGLKKQPSANMVQIQQLIGLIYRKYLRKQNKIHVAMATRKYIQDKLGLKTSAMVELSIFDEAQREVEHFMSKTTYPNFLKSDIYLHYVQSMQNGAGEDVSSKNGDAASSPTCSSAPSSRSSYCGGRADVAGPLPTVHEDSELNVSKTLTLTSNTLMATEKWRVGYADARRPEAYAGIYLQQNPSSKPVNPYHAMYGTHVPGSAQDSELQSLSSDAHTDETISQTDSSLDGRSGMVSRSYLKQQHRAMKQNASLNYDPHSQYVVIPRTHRQPVKVPCFSPDNPPMFADVLIKKLENFKKSQEMQERMEESLNNLEHDPPNKEKVSLRQCPPLTSLLTAAMAGIEADNGQSILDEHVSRIWNDSAHHTPTRTPGHHSPLPAVPCPKSPERRRASAPPVLNPYANKSLYPYHRHRKERDLVSNMSNDSGAIPDFVENETSSASGSDSFHFHPKYSHHHPNKSKGAAALGEPCASDMVVETSQRRSKETGKRNGSKKSFMDSSSSGIDSGVSLANEPNQPSTSGLNPKEKVMSWVLKSEKYCSSHPSDSEKESSSRHKRSSYSSMSATSPGPNRQSRGKKQVPYVSSRSGSLERSGHPSWSTSVAQPGQPIMGDPSMPMLPPPNTTTQLEEARRRLEDDTKSKLTKSKCGVSNKDRVPYLDLAKGGRTPLKSPLNGGVAASDSFEDGSHTNKKSAKKCSSSNSTLVTTPATPVAPEVEFTVVGYQFFGDDVPYLSKLAGKSITLKQFKTLITKKGNFRYFFKKASDEFGTGIVYEEVNEENDVLPLWEGKLFAKLEAID